jgi:hypothetical protein
MQNNSENALEHLFIENPFSGKMINILPILKLGQTYPFIKLNKGSESVSGMLDDSIRLICTSALEDDLIEQFRFTIDALYELRDAFKNAIELKKSKWRLVGIE